MIEPKRLDNKQIVLILKEVLAAMEVKDVNKFRIRAYQNVIASIDNLTISFYDLWKSNRIDEIPGVGGTLKQHFDDLFTKGSVKDFDDVRKGLPEGMFGLIGIRGIGAKKAYKLASAFNLNSKVEAVEQVKKLAEAGKIRELDGFGEKSEKDILNVITELKMHKKEKPRMLYYEAEQVSNRVLDHIKQLDCVKDAQALGSFRRKEATVGDLDIAVSTTDVQATIAHFLTFPEIHDVMGEGDKGARVVLTNDVQVDMRVSSPEAYGAMLQYFTGSKMHNVLLRTYSLEHGKSLSEYGIKIEDVLQEFPSEQAFYAFINLDYIPPELRQGKNEIDLAKKHMLPKLVSVEDIKGDLHLHTDASDGTSTLGEMYAACMAKGYKYMGITDHSPSIDSRGEEEVLNIISTQREHIEYLNKTNTNLKVLFGYEVNILVDATLGLPDKYLKLLDYVIASIHTGFTQDSDTITKRLINAIENPYVKIIGHPTGRLLNKRDSVDANWDKVLDAAKANNKIMEINAQPDRLDLGDHLVNEAVKKGVMLIVNTDSHNTESLGAMHYGINMARRGFCTKEHIANTLPLDEFLRILTH